MNFALMLEQLLPIVDDVYDRWTSDSQAIAKSLPSEIKITCRKGCGACCHFPVVPVTMGEAFILFNHLLAAGYSITRLQAMFIAGYSDRYLDFARNAEALPFDAARVRSFMKMKLPCPLFEKTPTKDDPLGGHCSAFSVRPLICDYFHSTDSPQMCARHEPHGTLTHIIQRGIDAVDELRAFERKQFGWSVLIHLPLAIAVLCTQAGLDFVTNHRVQAQENEDEQSLYEFQLFAKMVRMLGYQLGENDLKSLQLAQQEAGAHS